MKRKVIGIVLTTALVLSLGLVFAGPVGASTSNGNVLYGIIGTYLVTIDENTGDAIDVATLSGDTTGLMQDIAFDWQNGVLYGLARTSSTDRTPLLTTIDVCTGEVSIVGTITLTDETVYLAEGLAIDDQGTMYVSMSINGEPPSDYYSETLVTVNPADAVATLVGTISGTSSTVEDEADALECVDGTLYAVDDPGSGPSEVFTINTSTAVATSQGSLSSPRFNNIGDMAFNPDSDLLYGFDPGAQSMTYDRYLCTIGQTATTSASPIGIIHSASEFDGSIQGISWGDACNQTPDCSTAYAALGCLWPPNHKFVDINIMGVTDPDGDPITITITNITSDEPTATDKGSGGAKHAPDAIGVSTDTASVRAERSGRGDGRVYVIYFTASDGRGGTCEGGSVVVKVPHDQSDKTCPAIDSGQDYDATERN